MNANEMKEYLKLKHEDIVDEFIECTVKDAFLGLLDEGLDPCNTSVTVEATLELLRNIGGEQRLLEILKGKGYQAAGDRTQGTFGDVYLVTIGLGE